MWVQGQVPASEDVSPVEKLCRDLSPIQTCCYPLTAVWGELLPLKVWGWTYGGRWPCPTWSPTQLCCVGEPSLWWPWPCWGQAGCLLVWVCSHNSSPLALTFCPHSALFLSRSRSNMACKFASCSSLVRPYTRMSSTMAVTSWSPSCFINPPLKPVLCRYDSEGKSVEPASAKDSVEGSEHGWFMA